MKNAPGNQASRRVAEAAIVKLVDRKIVTSNVNYFEKLHQDTVLPGKKSHRKQEMTGRPPGKETLSARNSPSRCSTPGKKKGKGLRLTHAPGTSPAGKILKRKTLPGNRKLGNTIVGNIKQFFETSLPQVRNFTPNFQNVDYAGQTEMNCDGQPGQSIPDEQLLEPTGKQHSRTRKQPTVAHKKLS